MWLQQKNFDDPIRKLSLRSCIKIKKIVICWPHSKKLRGLPGGRLEQDRSWFVYIQANWKVFVHPRVNFIRADTKPRYGKPGCRPAVMYLFTLRFTRADTFWNVFQFVLFKLITVQTSNVSLHYIPLQAAPPHVLSSYLHTCHSR